ncbi:serine-rich adhesin for platelets [Anthonomus grandis grandis]|uniref:serine-rich adhesin for platelets n=1 Tax=Anthonomus grandis grandis TaxID=2921223 RepID=UPI0021656BF2|nr:serine-rich adhesin for platelets [Anthonomus grandis grandis]
MDRVLKRVGLTKRTQLDNETRLTTDENVKIRRRRRSKSRRRYQSNTEINKKSRGLFNIDWDVVKDCKSCKSKAITRRFCSKKVDNELYRSNSFKFERFIRNGEDLSPIKRKISLCEDYSLPADHLAELAKRRPNSIAVTNNCFLSQNFSDLILSSPEVEHVVVLDIYSTPRDSHQKLANQEEKYFTSPDKEYSQPYTTDESANPSVDEEDFAYHPEEKTNLPNLNSPDSVNEFTVQPPLSFLDVVSPTKTEQSVTKRHPSPYYYGDLFKYKTEQHTQSSPKKATYASVKKNQSLKEGYHKGEIHKRTKSFRKHKKHEGIQQNEEKQKSLRKRESFKQQKKTSSADSHSNSSRDEPNEKLEENQDSKSLNLLFYPEDGLVDMTRQRHVYETAFDCSINKSDDDLDQIERVTNHPVLVQWNNDKSGSESSTKGKIPTLLKATKSKTKEDNKPSHSKEDNNKSILNLSQTFQKIRLGSEVATSSSLGGSSLCGYTPSPPSTAPLPSKFPGKELMMNSIRSAPNLPSKTHAKELNLPNKSLKSRSSASSSGSLQIRHGSAFDIEFGSSSNINPLISEFKGRPGNSREQTGEMGRFSEIKSRPKPNLLMVPKDSVIRRIRHKYSSTESMTTSSSGGSMESIKSSTSEGNRSTSSSSSRQSASLSSHSSDSGSNRPKYYAPPQNFLSQQASNKLHILSPISDKSSQEPISETSDNNKNNNSQKCSPDAQNEATTSAEVKTTKKRFPQNKNLLSLNFHQDRPEIQGSDSGISIQSREGINKSRYTLGAADLLGPASHHDFSDLPFDMPKLRRRRILLDTACTSGSATSIDFKELPFDMPKLRRKLRLQTGNLEDSASQASSSQSVLEANRGHIRPKLTLNLGEVEGGRKGSGLGLTLSGIGTNEGASTSTQSCLNFALCENIDIGIPLEKQGWFHGSITRIEAENILRALREGSFLVRNSESIKNDYSLSLKSARGFMHMRIQRSNDNGCFILGQFSKPFNSIPEMIKHFSMNRLPIRGAEHMCLLQPVIAQLL